MEKLGPGDPPQIGAYRLLARLGAGGMGDVYLARSDRGRTVAVKLVRRELASQDEFRARFRQEVRAARQVGGFWTAPVLDADTEAEVPWVATGYVAGPSLQRVVGHDHGALPERSVRILTAGLAHALKDIHAAGIVHRDLKPSNVLVTIDGPRVIDFGIARALETVDETGLTRTGSLIGSPGFMAPEQVRGDRITPACDVFCLGSVLAYAATGRLPFGSIESGAHAVMFRIAQDEPDLEGVPEGIADLVRDCLRKAPEARPSLDALLERTGAEDTVSGGRSRDPWLPSALVAQLGRHAVRLLDAEDPVPAGTAGSSGAGGDASPGREGERPGEIPAPPAPAPGPGRADATPGPAAPGSAAAGSGPAAGHAASGPAGSGPAAGHAASGPAVPGPAGPGGPAASGAGPAASGAGPAVPGPAASGAGPAASGAAGSAASGAAGPAASGAGSAVPGPGGSAGHAVSGVGPAVSGPEGTVPGGPAASGPAVPGPADPADHAASGEAGHVASGPGGPGPAGHAASGAAGPTVPGPAGPGPAGHAVPAASGPAAGAPGPFGPGPAAPPAPGVPGAPASGTPGVPAAAGPVSAGSPEHAAAGPVTPTHQLPTVTARPGDVATPPPGPPGRPAGASAPGAAPAHPGYGVPQQHPQPHAYGYPPAGPNPSYPQAPHGHAPAHGATPPYGPGSPYGHTSYDPAYQPAPPDRGGRGGRSTVVLVIVALVVALAAGGSVYTLMSGGHEDEGGGRPTPAPTTAGATKDPAGDPTTASPAPSPSDSAEDGAVPAEMLGTWNASIASADGASSRRLTLRQGEVGDTVLTLVADGPAGSGTYHCEFTAELAAGPNADNTLSIGPSTVTAGAPPTCSPGKATQIRLLPDGRLERVTVGSGEKLTYSRQ
ncbi:protein kinase [Streptomyces sp. NPDC001651]|uniref:serine/threonine-protein kinase n=1 Tax=Streptomyces sp. NPDC001651 TaxID=3364596 RepID=UPI00368EFB50